MNCARATDLLMTSLDAPLSAAEQADVDAHVMECPACLERLKACVVTTQVLRGLAAFEDEELEDAPPLAEGFVQRVLAARRASAERRRTG